MRRAKINHIDRMVLTGAFGARFEWRNAFAIGMLPDTKRFSRVEIVENAVGPGAVKALLDKKYQNTARALLLSIKYLELAK